MKFKNLMAALENYEEAPITETEVVVADGDSVDPQVVVDASAPVNEPSTIPDAGQMPLGVPFVAPLPIIEEPVVAPVVPADVDHIAPMNELDPGASELVIESPLDHDNTMQMMDQTIVEQTQLGNELVEIVETQTALEHYARLLKSAGPDGITRQAAGFLRTGLEQFQNDGHIDFSGLIASMEDMGEGEKQHLLPSKIKSGGLGDKLKEVASKVWEWLKKIWGKSKEFISQFRNGVIGLERKLKKAEAAVGKAGNSGGGTFNVPNPDRIAVGNKVDINYPNSLKALAHLSSKVYPERMTQFYTAIASTISNYDAKSGDPAQVNGLLEKAADVLKDIKASEEVFPGNMKMDVSESGVSYGMTEGEKADVGETKAEGRSSSTISTQLKDMQTVVGLLKGYVDQHSKMSAAAEKVGQALERLKSTSAGEGMEAGAASTASDFESSVGKLLHQANPRGDEIIRYLARTTSAYADVILAELKVPGTGSKEVAVV